MIKSTLQSLLKIECQQAHDEGKDISALAHRLENIKHPHEAIELFLAIQKTPISLNYKYIEPNDLADILQYSPKYHHKKKPLNFDRKTYFNKIYGAVLGKCAGCLLGKPIEGWPRETIIQFLSSTNNLPLKKFPHKDLIHHSLKDYDIDLKMDDVDYHTFEHGMPEDDDVNYLLLQYQLIKKRGLNFKSRHVAECWLDLLPHSRLYTAERLAYRNFTHQILPPVSAYYCNPYREWVGAQIRADYFGYISLGNSALAATLAWRDARVSHVKNGIYGAIWLAVMYSLIDETGVNETLMTRALQFIPSTSRFYEEIMTIINRHNMGQSYIEIINHIHQKYNEKNIHHWCHVIPNAMIIATALLYSCQNPLKSLEISLTAGFDTDSNSATLGSLLGFYYGAKRLPEFMIDHFADTIHSSIVGMNHISIEKFTQNILCQINTLFTLS